MGYKTPNKIHKVKFGNVAWCGQVISPHSGRATNISEITCKVCKAKLAWETGEEPVYPLGGVNNKPKKKRPEGRLTSKGICQ